MISTHKEHKLSPRYIFGSKEEPNTKLIPNTTLIPNVTRTWFYANELATIYKFPQPTFTNNLNIITTHFNELTKLEKQYPHKFHNMKFIINKLHLVNSILIVN